MTVHFGDPEFPSRDSRSFISALSLDDVGIILITEGKDNDPFVYSMLLDSCIALSETRYEVVRIETIDLSGLGISKGSSGKSPMKSLFYHLKRASELSGKLVNEKYFCIFAMDKDVDDFTNQIISDDHVVYTPTYDIEGLLFSSIDIEKLICSAASADRPSVNRAIGICTAYDIVSKWQEWAALCYANAVLSIGHGVGYGLSRINSPYHASADIAALETITDEIVKMGETKGIVRSDFESKYQEGIELMKHQPMPKIFKGKWITTILCSITVSSLKGIGFDVVQMESKVKGVTRTLSDYNVLAWSEFRLAVSKAETHIR